MHLKEEAANHLIGVEPLAAQHLDRHLAFQRGLVREVHRRAAAGAELLHDLVTRRPGCRDERFIAPRRDGSAIRSAPAMATVFSTSFMVRGSLLPRHFRDQAPSRSRRGVGAQYRTRLNQPQSSSIRFGMGPPPASADWYSDELRRNAPGARSQASHLEHLDRVGLRGQRTCACDEVVPLGLACVRAGGEVDHLASSVRADQQGLLDAASLRFAWPRAAIEQVHGPRGVLPWK